MVYAFFVELFIHRELKLAHSHEVIADTTRLLGSLFPVLMFAVSLNTFLTYEQAPMAAAAWFAEHVAQPAGVFAGRKPVPAVGRRNHGHRFGDTGPGADPESDCPGAGHGPGAFRIVMIVNLEIGYLTPPFGLNLIIAMGAFKVTFMEACKSVVPFLALMLAGLLLVSFIPALSLLLLG